VRAGDDLLDRADEDEGGSEHVVVGPSDSSSRADSAQLITSNGSIVSTPNRKGWREPLIRA
jgi:hypothetical protein